MEARQEFNCFALCIECIVNSCMHYRQLLDQYTVEILNSISRQSHANDQTKLALDFCDAMYVEISLMSNDLWSNMEKNR